MSPTSVTLEQFCRGKSLLVTVNSNKFVREHGAKAESISRDHKPSDPDEQLRIASAGGKVYQSNVVNPNNAT